MASHFAVKSRDCERSRGVFAVMRGDHAAMRGHNDVKRVSFAAMRVHHATIGASNVAMEALITATCAFNAATLREDPHHTGRLTRPAAAPPLQRDRIAVAIAALGVGLGTP